MNFRKKIIKNTKTDNKVTLNDFICSFKFNLKSSYYLQHTVLDSKPLAEKFSVSNTEKAIVIQDPVYRDSLRNNDLFLFC